MICYSVGWGKMDRAKVSVLRGPESVGARQFEESGIQRSSLYRKYFKRLFDIAFVIAALPIVLPAFVVLYVIVKRDGGPFLYRHTRVGMGGKPFGCLKIRTMVVDSEAKLEELINECPEARIEWQQNFKLRNDPRITQVGKLLRKTSLDELPQIFNVLKGEMSVVGPRPITSEELEKFGDAVAYYEKVRPGLTGPWQITGRRENDFNSRAALDVKYVGNVNFLSDIYYLFATVPEVIFCRGR